MVDGLRSQGWPLPGELGKIPVSSHHVQVPSMSSCHKYIIWGLCTAGLWPESEGTERTLDGARVDHPRHGVSTDFYLLPYFKTNSPRLYFPYPDCWLAANPSQGSHKTHIIINSLVLEMHLSPKAHVLLSHARSKKHFWLTTVLDLCMFNNED